MAAIVVISSFVSAGTVGLQASGPALRSLGHDIIEVPTVVLSNHPGQGRVGRQSIPASALHDVLSALEANRRLNAVGAILTGYLPDVAAVRFAAAAVDRIKLLSPAALYVCDPIFGDDPGGYYLPMSVTAAIRSDLLPRADVTTPNRFELSQLASNPAANCAEAIAASRNLPTPSVVATSIPDEDGRIATVYAGPDGTGRFASPRVSRVPQGTGDVLSGLITGYLAKGHRLEPSVAAAHATLMEVVMRSAGRQDLDLSCLTLAGDPA